MPWCSVLAVFRTCRPFACINPAIRARVRNLTNLSWVFLVACIRISECGPSPAGNDPWVDEGVQHVHNNAKLLERILKANRSLSRSLDSLVLKCVCGCYCVCILALR